MRRGLCPAAMVATKVASVGACFASRWHASAGGGGGGGGGERGVRSAVEVTPPPPRPAFYVPPEDRDADDASLQFLRRKQWPPDDGSAAEKGGAPRLSPGQSFAPELPSRPARVPHYIDEQAAGLASTSVYAGHHLLPDEPERPTRRLRVIKDASPEPRTARGAPEANFLRTGQRDSIFEVKDTFGDEEGPGRAFAKGEKGDAGMGDAAPPERPLLQQMELDLRRLEYYQGAPQYQQLLEEFRSKYGSSEASNSTVGESGGGGGGSSPNGGEATGRSYNQAEVQRGLEEQPIDYLRSSNKLKVELSSGPRAYDPVVLMQRLGVMRFQGYAFPPTTEVGKLRGREGRALEPSVEHDTLKDYMRQSVSSTIKTQLAGGQDKQLLYRTLGLDAVQRRQVRAMLSDFDYSDRQTAFHVMMTYPYTDWVHVFYMVLVGLALYTLQLRCGAYEFYDEYLGLDLRQVPRLKKPFLAGVTVVVMVVALFHPLLVASIASTRLYRIFMRRPIGPP
ncbi:uncharacterized protein Tco025E_08226 [Trypanosoma conorhini]|uniref:Transmembrane protein n=1 Tax=Trypanosoma conorhini TaxID=83891 RepID=A0A3R7MIP8_9TRYP|nr:uncharacterized protein Tco025E_08226 [Trypanosoma conorhini]RNF03224.1 hypothetical protein Tco025E_08226 [Trypanosoma conorhini]